MANVNAIYSYTLQDADGERTAFPVYTVFDDGDTVADVATDLIATGNLLDAITEGQIVKTRVVIEIPLDGGYKVAPITGAEIEKTGLISYDLTTPAGKTYSQDIPTFANSLFVGNKINLSAAEVVAWTNRALLGTPPTEQNNLWSSTLADVRSGRKTFRKHRRQTERT
jgi:hypothetical protein